MAYVLKFAVAFAVSTVVTSFMAQPLAMSFDSAADFPVELPQNLPMANPLVLEALRDSMAKNRFDVPRNTTTVNFPPPTPPCCSDTISSTACRRLQNRNPANFKFRCENDPDFSLIQCCQSCGMESADERYSFFFTQNQASHHCVDRHSVDFCAKFLQKKDVWGSSQFTCDGQFATLAFRICRRTCGFCRKNLYKTTGGRYEVTSCGKQPRVHQELWN